jgi:peptidoglycan/xylan/chitin deacetylase (PgdA/CDA1 family)
MIAVMYHYVRDPGGRLTLPSLRPDHFRRQLDWFEGHGGIADAKEFMAALDGTAPPPGRYLLTFDDGLAEHAAIADLLESRGKGGFFFVSSLPREAGVLLKPHRLHLLLAAVAPETLLAEAESTVTPAMIDGEALSRFGPQLYRNQPNRTPEVRLKMLFNYHLLPAYADELLGHLFRRHLGDDREWLDYLYLPASALRRLSGRHVVGNHTRSHPVLARLDADAQRQEIEAGGAWLESQTGLRTTAFCYPYGVPETFTGVTESLLAAAGYGAAFVYDEQPIEWPAKAPLRLGRSDCNRYPEP